MAGKIYQTAIAISATISKGFKSDILGGAKAVEKLGAETKKLKATSAAIAAFEKLGKEVATAQSKLDAATIAQRRHMLATAAILHPTKEQTEQTRKLAAEVKLSERGLLRAQKATEKTGQALVKAGVDTNALTAAQHRLGEELEKTERRMKRAELVEHHFGETITALKKKAHEYGSVEGSAGLVKERIRGLGETAIHMAELTVGAEGAAFAIFEVAKSTAEASHELETSAVKLGTTTEALQLIRFAGKASGVEVEALDTALGKMAITIGKLATAKKKGGGGGGFSGEVGGLQFDSLGKGGGSATVIDPLKQIGLSAQRLKLLAPEEQFAKIAEGIKGLKTHSEQSAAAVAIFGKGGLSSLPLLLKGGEEIEELYDKMRASGALLSEEAKANAKEFHHQYLGVELSVSGLKNTLGSALLPVVTKVLGSFNVWLQSNRENVKKWAGDLAIWLETKAIPAVERLIPQVKALVLNVGDWIEKGVKLVGGLENVGYAIVGLKIAPLIVATGSLLVNFTALAASNPFGATLLAIGAIITASYAAAEAIDEMHAARLRNEDEEEFKVDEARRAYARNERYLASIRGEGAYVPQATPARASVAGGGAGGPAFTFAPVLQISPGMDKAGVASVLADQQEDFERRMREYAAGQARLSFDH